MNLVQPLVGPNQRYLTKVDLIVRRRRADHRRPRRRVAHRRRADGDVPDARRSRGWICASPTPTWATSRTAPYTNSVGFAEIRLRDDAPGAQRRARRRDRAHADRPRRRGRRQGGRPAARVPDEPLTHRAWSRRTYVAGRGRAGPSLPRARRPHLRRCAAPPASPPTRPTRCSTRCSASPTPTRAASRSRRRSTSRATSRRAGRRRSTAIPRPRGAPRSARPVGQWVDVHHPAAGHLRPSRPAGGGRRQALGADAAADRRGRRVAHRRRARDHRRQGRRRAGHGAGDVRAAHRLRRARHRHRGARR